MAEIIDGVHQITKPERYVDPTDPNVLEHLEWFKDQKLGFMLHWAPGSQFGVTESWTLATHCPWDEPTLAPWQVQEINWIDDLDAYRASLRATNKTFNPVKFNPQRWAKLAKECGFKYLLATTKHHDGFCMYDSQYTNYKITSPDCPFHTNKNADIIRALYDAFRAEGMGISTYFSKPDWASPDFWVPEYPNDGSINANYDPLEEPERWARFVEFSHNQMTELTSNYGKIDVLWLDGGWATDYDNHQHMHLERLIPKIRATTQPHLIVADRTAGGEFENIITPEQTVPDVPMDVPWESCITLNECWSFQYDQDKVAKSPREVIHLLIGIVAKGGNLALNVSPQPDGELSCGTLQVLNELGAWLKLNGEGIYGTRPVYPWSHRNICYTKKGSNIYAFILYRRDYQTFRSAELQVEGTVKDVILLRTGESVPFTQHGDKVLVNTCDLPLYDMKYADCLKVVF